MEGYQSDASDAIVEDAVLQLQDNKDAQNVTVTDGTFLSLPIKQHSAKPLSDDSAADTAALNPVSSRSSVENPADLLLLESSRSSVALNGTWGVTGRRGSNPAEFGTNAGQSHLGHDATDIQQDADDLLSDATIARRGCGADTPTTHVTGVDSFATDTAADRLNETHSIFSAQDLSGEAAVGEYAEDSAEQPPLPHAAVHLPVLPLNTIHSPPMALPAHAIATAHESSTLADSDALGYASALEECFSHLRQATLDAESLRTHIAADRPPERLSPCEEVKRQYDSAAGSLRRRRRQQQLSSLAHNSRGVTLPPIRPISTTSTEQHSVLPQRLYHAAARESAEASATQKTAPPSIGITSYNASSLVNDARGGTLPPSISRTADASSHEADDSSGAAASALTGSSKSGVHGVSGGEALLSPLDLAAAPTPSEPSISAPPPPSSDEIRNENSRNDATRQQDDDTQKSTRLDTDDAAAPLITSRSGDDSGIVEAGAIVVGLLSASEFLARERASADAVHGAALLAKARLAGREERLTQRERAARARLANDRTGLRAAVRDYADSVRASEAARERSFFDTMVAAEAELRASLTRQMDVFHGALGALRYLPNASTNSISSSISFTAATPMLDAVSQLAIVSRVVPRPVRVRIAALRGVRDRLPKGYYVLTATPYDELGGLPLAWISPTASVVAGIASCIDGLRDLPRMWESAFPGNSAPMQHGGRFDDVDVDLQPMRPLLLAQSNRSVAAANGDASSTAAAAVYFTLPPASELPSPSAVIVLTLRRVSRQYYRRAYTRSSPDRTGTTRDTSIRSTHNDSSSHRSTRISDSGEAPNARSMRSSTLNDATFDATAVDSGGDTRGYDVSLRPNLPRDVKASLRPGSQRVVHTTHPSSSAAAPAGDTLVIVLEAPVEKQQLQQSNPSIDGANSSVDGARAGPAAIATAPLSHDPSSNETVALASNETPTLAGEEKASMSSRFSLAAAAVSQSIRHLTMGLPSSTRQRTSQRTAHGTSSDSAQGGGQQKRSRSQSRHRSLSPSPNNSHRSHNSSGSRSIAFSNGIEGSSSRSRSQSRDAYNAPGMPNYSSRNGAATAAADVDVDVDEDADDFGEHVQSSRHSGNAPRAPFPGTSTMTDGCGPGTVLAWTAFPAWGVDLAPVAGKLKLPLLRGAVDSRFRTFADLEAFASDLSEWAGNLYVDVAEVPRAAVLNAVELTDCVIEFSAATSAVRLVPTGTASEHDAQQRLPLKGTALPLSRSRPLDAGTAGAAETIAAAGCYNDGGSGVHSSARDILHSHTTAAAPLIASALPLGGNTEPDSSNAQPAADGVSGALLLDDTAAAAAATTAPPSVTTATDVPSAGGAQASSSSVRSVTSHTPHRSSGSLFRAGQMASAAAYWRSRASAANALASSRALLADAAAATTTTPSPPSLLLERTASVRTASSRALNSSSSLSSPSSQAAPPAPSFPSSRDGPSRVFLNEVEQARTFIARTAASVGHIYGETDTRHTAAAGPPSAEPLNGTLAFAAAVNASGRVGFIAAGELGATNTLNATAAGGATAHGSSKHDRHVLPAPSLEAYDYALSWHTQSAHSSGLATTPPLQQEQGQPSLASTYSAAPLSMKLAFLWRAASSELWPHGEVAPWSHSVVAVARAAAAEAALRHRANDGHSAPPGAAILARIALTWSTCSAAVRGGCTAAATGLNSYELWTQLTLLLSALWTRAFLHGLGQYLYLGALRIPVFAFYAIPAATVLRFPLSALPTEVQIGVVAAGPLFTMAVFFVLASGAGVARRVAGIVTPDIPSRFIACLGIAAALDPLLTLVIDAALGRFSCAASYPAICGAAGPFAGMSAGAASPQCSCSTADALILPARFAITEGSITIGVLLTVLLYVTCTLIAGSATLLFLLREHRGGRVMDTFRRVTGRPVCAGTSPGSRPLAPLPSDTEISREELAWVVSKALRWRGGGPARSAIGGATAPGLFGASGRGSDIGASSRGRVHGSSSLTSVRRLAVWEVEDMKGGHMHRRKGSNSGDGGSSSSRSQTIQEWAADRQSPVGNAAQARRQVPQQLDEADALVNVLGDAFADSASVNRDRAPSALTSSHWGQLLRNSTRALSASITHGWTRGPASQTISDVQQRDGNTAPAAASSSLPTAHGDSRSATSDSQCGGCSCSRWRRRGSRRNVRVLLYTEYSDGSIEPYRSFLRTAGGVIIEEERAT